MRQPRQSKDALAGGPALSRRDSTVQGSAKGPSEPAAAGRLKREGHCLAKRREPRDADLMNARTAGHVQPSVVEVLVQRVASEQTGRDGIAEGRRTAQRFNRTKERGLRRECRRLRASGSVDQA